MVWSNGVADPEIVRLIRDDPQAGFTLLLQRYGGRIQGYLRQRFPSLDPGDLCDAMTDAMLSLADSFDAQRGSLPAWFLLLAHQKAVGRLRSQNPRRRVVAELVGDEPDRGGDPLSQVESRERLDEVYKLIRNLPALERSVLEADLEEGRTVAADTLARQLGTTAGSIYAARRRARQKLIQRCNWVRAWLQSGKIEDDEE